MIPSHWFRRIILIAFIMGIADGILWVTGRLSTNLAAKPMTQALDSLIFLFDFYVSAPLSARFLAPRPSRDAALQERSARTVATVPDSRPVLLYDHVDKEANTVGLLPSHSRIYATTSLLASMSDEGMWGMIAYKDTHAHERHILTMFIYACCFAMSSHLLDNNNFFFTTFLLFLGVRRYYEHRVDAGAAQSAGREAILTVLREPTVLYPSKFWVRRFSFASAYPTLATRMRTVETERKALL